MRQFIDVLYALRLQSVPALFLCAVLCGCSGKTLVDDNPVFTAAPPRKSLSNASTVVNPDETSSRSVVQAVSLNNDDATVLTGNSVVAEVNGSPIFVDDIIGSVRLAVEADPRLSMKQRQEILRAQLKPRLQNYVDQEIVLQALRQAFPEEQQKLIKESLEDPFKTIVADIKADHEVQTDAELNKILSEQGLSIDLLRESFVRIQMVQGYLSTKDPPSEAVDRVEMVQYYKTHPEEFTPEERVRGQEIVVRFDAHGGRDGANQQMATVIQQLQQGADFADLAVKYSDALSAEKRGDLGWLTRGSLADKAIENKLFELKSGQTTDIYTHDDRLEVFRVMDHEFAVKEPFQEVQQKIEALIKQQRTADARRKSLEDLRAKANIVTMFDEKSTSL